MVSLTDEIGLPSDDEIRLARESAPVFEQPSDREAEPLLVVVNGKKVKVPSSLGRILGASLKLMAEGQSVAVIPLDEEIDTQEAADLLGVSRSFLINLLDTGAIPSRKVGVQRRVKVGDVVEYQNREKDARREVLRELAAEDQKLKLGG